MKRILLPIDFSPHAANAVQYAVRMFGKVFGDQTELILLNVYQPIAAATPYAYGPPAGIPMLLEEVRKRVRAECLKYQDAFPGPIFRDYVYAGAAAEGILEVARDEAVDAIVIGTRGSGSIDRLIMGSTASAVARRAACPVLIIPEKAVWKEPRRIVFATDFRNLEELSILNPLRTLVKTYDPEFMMLHIYSERTTTETERQTMDHALNAYFNTEHYRHFFLEHEDPVEGIEVFAKSFEADILALVGQERRFFEQLFHRSVTRRMLMHTEMPVFVLHGHNWADEEAREEKPFRERAAEQFRNWKAEWEEINLQLHLGRKEAREKLGALKERLERFEDIAEDKWDQFRKEIAEAFQHLRKAFGSKRE